ncbi:hypothetical protein [Lyngbya aestuarii]|uniref:hypothetical protein n=1 Tax=Lyngbya aestuarii TaxID=118322 RepID=UPI00403DBD15
MLKSSDTTPEQPHRLHPLNQLLRTHPLAFCAGLWVALVLAGSLAAAGLLNPGSAQKEVSRQTPAIVKVRESTAQDDLPLSLFGALTLGCAATSLLITRALKNSTSSNQPPKRLKQASAVRKKRRVASQKRHSVHRKSEPVAPSSSFPTLNKQVPNDSKQLSRVTILPPEQRYPLDVDERGLAEMMDLRKQQSLGSLMRKD